MPEQTIKRVDLPSTGILDAIRDTKQAAVFSTLGLPFKSPGIFVTYDKDNPQSSGGIAHFVFASDDKNSVGRLLEVWEKANADVELDKVLEDLETDIPGISQKFTDAVIVYCRRALENYRSLIHFIKTEAQEFVVVGGEEVKDEKGETVGRQGFTVKRVKRK